MEQWISRKMGGARQAVRSRAPTRPRQGVVAQEGKKKKHCREKENGEESRGTLFLPQRRTGKKISKCAQVEYD